MKRASRKAGNPLIWPALQTHLTNTQRAMGEVLIRDERPRDIRDQHAAVLQAITKGDGACAEALVRGLHGGVAVAQAG